MDEMRRKTKRKMTKAKVVFCSRDMAAVAELDEDKEEDDEEEERATKCPPEYRVQQRAESRGEGSSLYHPGREVRGGGKMGALQLPLEAPWYPLHISPTSPTMPL